MRLLLLILVASLASASASRLFSDDLSTLAARQLLQTTTGSVYAACPSNCDTGRCAFDSSNAGYKCTKCVNNLVVVKGRCACPAGRYLNVGTSTCVDCPLNSWCPGGTYDQAQPNNADNLNQAVKNDCTNNLITRAKRSRARTQCVNPPGKYFSTVNAGGVTGCTTSTPCAIACPADSFTPGLAKQKACTPCPTGFKTNGGSGAISSQACGVPPGYYLKTPGQVAPCPKGEYQESWMPPTSPLGKCTSCGIGITTVANNAATSRQQCKVAQAGYVALTGDAPAPFSYIQEAVKCPQKFYCPGGVVSDVMDTANPTADQQMYACTVSGVTGLWTQGVGATSIAECMVPPGYGKAASGSGAITKCSSGQYREGWLLGNKVNSASDVVCKTCGANILGVQNDEIDLYTYNPSSQDYDITPENVASSSGNCYINAGMGMYYIAGSGNAGSSYRALTCLPANNQYGVATTTYGLAANPCKPCPTGLVASGYEDPTSGGVTSADACVTQPGWGWDGRVSTECPKGSWAVGSNLLPCTECGFGLTTAGTAATASADCLLAQGYGSVSGTIQLCPLGSYNPQDAVRATNADCTACPDSRTSTEVGAADTSDCDACPTGTGASDATALAFTTSGCTDCSSGYYGPNRQSVTDQSDQTCVACPTSTTGFQFFYNGAEYPYVAPAVSKDASATAGDCLAQYAQITDGLWYFATGTSVAAAGDANLAACLLECTTDATCQFATYDYAASSDKCSLYSATGTGAILAYKAVPSGDIYAAAQSVKAKSATPSGLYTQWTVDFGLTPPGTATSTGSTTKEACFNDCDADTECAAVFFIEGTSCAKLKGVATPGGANAAKRTLTRAIPAQAYL